MKTIASFLLCFCTFGALGQSKSYDYCYTKGTGVWVYAAADKKDYPILSGKSAGDAQISPDGTKVAYTAVSGKGDRTISVIDLNTKKKTPLRTSSKNCYGPIWSPDGRRIAYNVFDTIKAKWNIFVIDTNNTSPRMVTGKIEECFAPTWWSDSKHIVVHNLSAMYVFDLSGKIDATYDISTLANTLGASSSDRFIFTDDNSKIVFSAGVDEQGFDDGPPTAIFVYDIAQKSSMRLTPKGYYANGFLIKGSKVLFNGGKINAKTDNVYAVDLDGKNLKVLFANCREISAKL